MTGAQARAAAELAGRAASGATEIVEGIHRAVSDRVERVTGAAAAPIHAVTEVVETGIYSAIRGGLTLAANGAGAVASSRTGRPSTSGTTTVRAAALLAALNGAAGGLLADEDNPLAIELTARAHGRATSRIAVLVHGLGESDLSWRAEPDYRVLVRELGWTPVLVHYNTGRHIWQSGDDLTVRLTELIEAWPGPVQEIAFIGHSMGGLVARSAVHESERRGVAWLAQVTRVVTLGTPHEGAPLARLGHRTRTLLTRLPETKPLARILDFERSPGVDDLRAGAVSSVAGHGHKPLPEHIRVATLCATLAKDERHPVSRLLGDLLVTAASATSNASGRRTEEDRRHVGGLNHFDLLGHPDVAEQLRSWLA